MTGTVHVEIVAAPIDTALLQARVMDQNHGGLCSFMGAVRGRNLGRDVTGISYDVCVPLATNMLTKICTEIRADYNGKIHIALAHAQGLVKTGEISVAIFVSTPHRAESFEACRKIIEALKHKAPIWKQEHYTDGDSAWAQGHALCQHAS